MKAGKVHHEMDLFIFYRKGGDVFFKGNSKGLCFSSPNPESLEVWEWYGKLKWEGGCHYWGIFGKIANKNPARKSRRMSPKLRQQRPWRLAWSGGPELGCDVGTMLLYHYSPFNNGGDM